MRLPTDDTPPIQRRLVENNALVELIQTTKYLKDAPPWDKEDSTPKDMETLSIEDEVMVEEEEEGIG